MFAEIHEDLAEPESRFGTKLRILRRGLERLHGALFLLGLLLHHAGASDAKIRAGSVFAVRETLDAVEKRGFRLGILVTQQIGEADVEVKLLKLRDLVVAKRLEQLLDLCHRLVVVLRLERRLGFVEEPVPCRGSHHFRGSCRGARRRRGWRLGTRTGNQRGEKQRNREDRG